MSTDKLGIGSRVNHSRFGEGVIVESDAANYKIYFSGEVKTISREFSNLDILEKKEADFEPISLKDIEKAVENVLAKSSESGRAYPMAAKWTGGTITINPGNAELQEKSIPVVSFFNKIISIREKLRVLEQNINNHDKLDEQEKLHLQQYITRAYGSLTTFNVLFANKNDQFKGTGKDS